MTLEEALDRLKREYGKASAGEGVFANLTMSPDGAVLRVIDWLEGLVKESEQSSE